MSQGYDGRRLGTSTKPMLDGSSQLDHVSRYGEHSQGCIWSLIFDLGDTDVSLVKLNIKARPPTVEDQSVALFDDGVTWEGEFFRRCSHGYCPGRSMNSS